MSKRNLKLIMELIFIFILPLLFICFTSEIQIERNFEYDNNGNYETSIESKNLSFDNSIIKYTKTPLYKNYLNLNQHVNNPTFTSFSSWSLETVYNNYTIDNGLKITVKQDYGANYGTLITYYPLDVELNHKCYIYVDVDNPSNLTYRIRYPIVSNDLTSSYGGIYTYTDTTKWIMVQGLNYHTGDIITIKKIIIVDLTEMYGSGYEPTTTQQLLNDYNVNQFNQYIDKEVIEIDKDTIISENNEINYTIWGNIKKLLVTNLDLNDNVLIEIVLCYMILWVINWIIWHIFYGFLELIIHIIPRKWERD